MDDEDFGELVGKLRCLEMVCGCEIFIPPTSIEILLKQVTFAEGFVDELTWDRIESDSMATLCPSDAYSVILHWDCEGTGYVILKDNQSNIHTYMLRNCDGTEWKNTTLYAFLYKNLQQEIRLGVFDVLTCDSVPNIGEKSALERHCHVHRLLTDVSQTSGILRHHWAGFKHICDGITDEDVFRYYGQDFHAYALVCLVAKCRASHIMVKKIR